MHKLQLTHFFDAAHQLPDSQHLVTKKCANLHGHTYAVIVKAFGSNSQGGMVVDFKGIKEIIDELDHVFINDVFKNHVNWAETPSTAENIAIFLYERIQEEYGKYLEQCIVSVDEGYKGVERANWVSYPTNSSIDF